MKVQDLVDTPPPEQKRSKAVSIADDVQSMLAMAGKLAEELGDEQARDFFRGASSMVARGNAELIRGVPS